MNFFRRRRSSLALTKLASRALSSSRHSFLWRRGENIFLRWSLEEVLAHSNKFLFSVFFVLAVLFVSLGIFASVCALFFGHQNTTLAVLCLAS